MPNEAKLSLFDRLNLGSDKDFFLENITLLLSAGNDIVSSLETIKKESRSTGMKKAVEMILNDVNSGVTLWKAIDHTGLFSSKVIQMIKVGEESGRLAENLEAVAFQQQKEREFKGKIQSAMMYPVFVFGLTVFIGIGISWFVLPRLATVFNSLKLELPLITRLILGFGKFVGEYGIYAIPAFLFGCGLIFYLLFYFKKTKFIGQSILFMLPGIKKLLQEVEISRFSFILGTQMQAGLQVDDALKSLADSTELNFYKKFYDYLYQSIQEGNSFAKSFLAYKKTDKLLPTSVQQMIISGENSGQLAETLIKVGEIFEKKTDNTTKNISTLIEPIMLVIVWLGVVVVALAVILPIYNLVGGLNNQRSSASRPVTQQIPPVVTDKVTPEATTSAKNSQLLQILPTGESLLNVRQTPAANGRIITKVSEGQRFEWTDQNEEWFQIKLPEGTASGWIFKRYAEEIF